jgi:hypothetical protein
MKSKFIQKRGIGYSKFYLYEDKVVVETRDLRKINKYEVPIEQLGMELQYQADNVIAGKIAVVVCTIVSIASLISCFFQTSPKEKNIAIFNSICFFLIAIFMYLKPHADDVYLVGGNKNLMFYRNRPNEDEVLKFLNEVIETTKSFVRKNYLKFDDNTNQDEYFARLDWYLRKKIITDDERQDLKEEFTLKRLL